MDPPDPTWRPFTQARLAPPAIRAVRAEGASIFDDAGREYLDLISSWWVTLHGHGEPSIARAIAEQAARLDQANFADFTHDPAVALARGIVALLPRGLTRIFYSDDGSTAVEVALKIAVQYWKNIGQPRRTRFVAFDGGYHGDTVGAMSLGQSTGFFGAWNELLFPVDVALFPATWDGDDDIDAKERDALAKLRELLASTRGETAAILIEPLVQGAGGMKMCRPSFIRALRDVADEFGTLLVFDEVMTGFGRTGDVFACIGVGVRPDLVCLAKGITGGFLPLGATVATEAIYAAFEGDTIDRAFLHGHSYTANPIACAAGVASLAILTSDACRATRERIEADHRAGLAQLIAAGVAIMPRVCGTIAAFDFSSGEHYGGDVGRRVKAALLARGLFMRPLGSTLYLLPPYCVSRGQLQNAYAVIGDVLLETKRPPD